jgi:hypothetical protein
MSVVLEFLEKYKDDIRLLTKKIVDTLSISNIDLTADSVSLAQCIKIVGIIKSYWL